MKDEVVYEDMVLRDAIYCAEKASFAMKGILEEHKMLEQKLGNITDAHLYELVAGISNINGMKSNSNKNPADILELEYKLEYLKIILDENELIFQKGYNQLELGKDLAVYNNGIDVFGENACGLCTVSTVLYDLLGYNINPLDIGRILGKDITGKGMDSMRAMNGTSTDEMLALFSAFGLSYASGINSSTDKELMNEMLDNGSYDFICTAGEGGAHWFAVTNHKVVDGEDMYLVVDSYRPNGGAYHEGTDVKQWLTYDEAFNSNIHSTVTAVSSNSEIVSNEQLNGNGKEYTYNGFDTKQNTSSQYYIYYNAGDDSTIKTNLTSSKLDDFEKTKEQYHAAIGKLYPDIKDETPDPASKRVLLADACAQQRNSPDLFNFIIENSEINEESYYKYYGSNLLYTSEKITKKWASSNINNNDALVDSNGKTLSLEELMGMVN